MQKVKGKKLKEIESIFPHVKLADLCPDHDRLPGDHTITPLKKEITDMYSFFSVSVFDHILTEEEFSNENALDFCTGVINATDSSSILHYTQHELKFVNFYCRIRQFMRCENIFLYKEDKGFYKFIRWKSFYKSTIDHIRETTQNFERYCFPELGVLITPGWYLTHHIVANTALYKKDEFEKIIHDCGLHILPLE